MDGNTKIHHVVFFLSTRFDYSDVCMQSSSTVPISIVDKYIRRVIMSLKGIHISVHVRLLYRELNYRISNKHTA
jgi:hypothetical protein